MTRFLRVLAAEQARLRSLTEREEHAFVVATQRAIDVQGALDGLHAEAATLRLEMARLRGS